MTHFRILGAALGKDCEVVLHDLRYPDESVIAIANGDISSRKVGAPATDFILKLMQVGKKRDQEYMTNYYGKSVNGHTLRSSTFFIHDEEDNIIGALCLNYDVQRYLDVRKQLDAFILMDPGKHIDGMPQDNAKKEDDHFLSVEISESMYPTVDDAIQHLIQRTLAWPLTGPRPNAYPRQNAWLSSKTSTRTASSSSKAASMPWPRSWAFRNRRFTAT